MKKIFLLMIIMGVCFSAFSQWPVQGDRNFKGNIYFKDTALIPLIQKYGGSTNILQNQTYNDTFNLTSYKEVYYYEYIQNGAMVIPYPIGTYGHGQKFTLAIFTDGNTITINSGYNLVSSDFSTSVTGMYYFNAVNIGGQWLYSFLLCPDCDTIPTPTILGGTIAADNSYIDVDFNTNVYGINNGTAPVVLSDFSVNFAQNGGTATNWTADSITDNNNNNLTTGEDTIRIYGTVTGSSSGVETLTVTPVDGTSIYNIKGVAVDAGQTTGAVTLSGELPIVWTNLTNATAIGNTLTITLNGGGGTDARYIPAGSEGYVIHEIRSLTDNELGVFGLSVGSGFETWDAVDYGIYKDASDYASSIKNGAGVVTSNPTTMQVGAILKVAKEHQGGGVYDIVYYYDVDGLTGFVEVDRTTSISDVNLYPKGSVNSATGGSEIYNAFGNGIQ